MLNPVLVTIAPRLSNVTVYGAVPRVLGSMFKINLPSHTEQDVVASVVTKLIAGPVGAVMLNVLPNEGSSTVQPFASVTTNVE